MILQSVASPNAFLAMAIIPSIFLAIGVFALVAGIMSAIRIGRASRLVGPCLLYYKQENIIEMTSLGGYVIRLSPKELIDAKAGFSTDFMLVVTYVDGYGNRRRANLGFTLNRDVSVQKILLLKKRAKK